METKRIFYVTSVAANAVQLTRHPNHGNLPDSDPGISMHQVDITTGNAAAASASATYWLTGCVLYEVTVKRLG